MDKKLIHVFCLGSVILLFLGSMATVVGYRLLQPSPKTTDTLQNTRDGIIVSGTMGENGWYISSVMVIFNFSSPPAPWWYQINGDGWQQYSTPILIEPDGIYLVEATSDFELIYNVTVKIDQTPPDVNITQPKKGYLYICLLNYIFKIIPNHIIITTIIIGRINVMVNATDSLSGINRVEFYIDNELQYTDYTAPYEWLWADRGFFFPYTVTVIAYDNAGNNNSISLRIWKIF